MYIQDLVGIRIVGDFDPVAKEFFVKMIVRVFSMRSVPDHDTENYIIIESRYINFKSSTQKCLTSARCSCARLEEECCSVLKLVRIEDFHVCTMGK